MAVTINRIAGQAEDRGTDFYGLSTDTKPIDDDIPNGSLFIEIDTGTGFMFDAQNKVWYEV